MEENMPGLKKPDFKSFQVNDEVKSAVETGGYTYRDCKILTMIFNTDPAVVAELLPPPLTLLDSEQMIIVFSIMNGISPGGRKMPPYHEIVLGVPAMTDNIPGMYCVQLYLDGITPGSEVYPTMAGQLVYGYPKREARIEMFFSDKEISVNASRHGQDIIRAAFTLGTDLPMPEDLPEVYQYGLKYIPSIEEGALPDVAKLTRWEMKPGTPMALKSATVASGAEKIVLDTGRVIPIKGIVDVSYALTGFKFGYGNVVWDYLA